MNTITFNITKILIFKHNDCDEIIFFYNHNTYKANHYFSHKVDKNSALEFIKENYPIVPLFFWNLKTTDEILIMYDFLRNKIYIDNQKLDLSFFQKTFDNDFYYSKDDFYLYDKNVKFMLDNNLIYLRSGDFYNTDKYKDYESFFDNTYYEKMEEFENLMK